MIFIEKNILHHILYSSAPSLFDTTQDISVGMFTVNCDSVLRALTEKHKALMTAILDIIAKRTRDSLADIAASYDSVQKKLLERCTSIEDLVTQKQCILERSLWH